MGVYPHKNSGYFHYDFVLKGRRFHGSTGVKTRRAAERIEARLRVDAAEGRLGDCAQLTLDEASGRWWHEHGQYRGDADKLESRIDAMLAAVGSELRLAEIDQAKVAEAIERRRGMAFRRSKAKDAKTYLPANATVNRDVVETLRTILERAKTHWNAQGLPEIAWGKLRLEEPRETVRVYSGDEERAWMAECRRTGWIRGKATPKAADVSLALDLMLTYGLRFGELFFDPAAYDPTGPRLYWLKGRKGDVPMIVPLLERHAREIAARVGRAQDAGLPSIWFYEQVNRDGSFTLVPITYSGLEARLSAAADRAKVPPGRRIHGGRHHAGTTLYRETEDLKVVQAMLGHADLKSTMRYVHAGEGRVRQALQDRESRNSPEAPPVEAKKA